MNLSTRRIGIAVVAVVLVLSAIWYAAIYRPQSAKLKAAHRDYAAAQVKLEQLRTQLASLEALQKQIPADLQRLAVLDKALPTTADLKDVLGQLHNAATASGVQLSAVSPSGSPTSSNSTNSGQPSGGVQTIQLSMSANGSYAELMAFVTQLTQMARAVTVTSLSLSAGSSGGLTASLNASIFYAP